ncbi:MAG TPA: hypothetical protein VF455_00520, partial [Chryseobacterium sp.]
MMTEQTADAQYQTGFNEGYIITQHLPELSDKLSQINSELPRIDGFKEGRKQFVLEQVREHRPAWMKEDTAKGQQPENL